MINCGLKNVLVSLRWNDTSSVCIEQGFILRLLLIAVRDWVL